MDRIRESLEDPELTSCRNEIALIDARLSDLAQQLTAGGSADAFLSIRKIADGLRYYLDRPDVVDREERLEKLGEELQHELQVGVNESRVWREIHAALIQRRRLADTERKREELLAATLPHAQAVAFIGAVQTAVRELVTDKHTRAAIARRVAGIMHRSAPGPSPVLTGVDTGATHPALLHQQLAVEVEDGEFEVVKETP
jgi:hypothetical protein